MSARRIKVLYVVGNFVAGGAERHLLELWRRLDRAKFEVEIACFRREGQFLADVEALGWPLRELRVGRRIYDATGALGLLRLIRATLRFRPDVIHGYLFGPNLFAAIAGRACGVRAVVVAKRNVDAFETPRQIAVQRVAHRMASHVTAVSQTVADTVAALGVPRERITVIPNGVDAGRFPEGAGDRSLLGVNGNGPVIGSVGCLEPRKDYGTLLDALAALRARGIEFSAAIIGEGRERAALEDRARALGLETRVKFLGERPDIDRLLPALDVFVLSSREEGISNALLEAMAAGRASVATAVGGTPEVLKDGETGWLVPARSPSALAAALAAVLADPVEAERRGQAARRYAREELSIDAMARRHEAFYAKAAGRAAA